MKLVDLPLRLVCILIGARKFRDINDVGEKADIEASSLIAGVLSALDPGLVFTDFGAAFASLLQRWLFFVLLHKHIPVWLYLFIVAIYTHCTR